MDTSDVPPTPAATLASVMRADVPGDCLPNAAALANAPDSGDGFFRAVGGV